MVEIKNKSGKVIFTYDGESLSNADLSNADLRYVDLSNANLIGANLIGADLRYVNLSGANLRYVDLSGVDTEFGKLQDIMQVSNIGSRKDVTVVYHTEQGIFVKCGCFKGSLAEFEARVKETHKGNDYEKAYLAMIELVKVRFQNK